ncbi:RNA polymerase sigma factor [Desulfomarina sp.]
MLQVKKGDLDAFDRLITRYRDPVVNTLCRITGTRDGAEDLAQEVFLRVFRARKTYKPRAKFTTWLFRIVKNIGANAVRDRNRAGTLVLVRGGGPGSGEPSLADRQPGPEERAGAADLQRALRKALAALSFDQRMAVVLTRLEGMTCGETAEIMESSEGAVKMLVNRARKILARELSDFIGES